MTFPAVRAFKETFVYLRDHAAPIARVIWPAALILVVWSIWVQTQMQDLRPYLQAARQTGDNAEYAAAYLSNYGWRLAKAAVGIVFGSVIAAALLRPLLRGGWQPERDYLDFGADEKRVLGAMFVLTCVGLIYEAARTFTNFSGGAGIFIALGLVAVLYVRLSVATVAAADGHGFGIVKSYQMTRGHFWRLAGYWMLVGVPFAVLIFTLSLAGSLLGSARNIHTGAIMFPDMPQWTRMLTVIVVNVIATPIATVAAAIAYRHLAARATENDSSQAAPSALH